MPKATKQRASKTATKAKQIIPAKFAEPEPKEAPTEAIQLHKVKGNAGLILRQHYSADEIALMKQTVAQNTTDLEFSWFLYVAKQRQLNPLTRQIHCVKRKQNYKDEETGQWLKKDVMTIQTGIDGYRTIAARAQVIPSDKPPLFEGEGADFRCTAWVKKWAHGAWHEVAATAYYTEFVQLVKDGNNWVPNSMWKKMPHNQLAKCAEALALRKAAPEDCGNIYVDEELEHLDHADVTPAAKTPSQEARAEKKTGAVNDASTIRQSSETNRGHGNEGMAAASRESEKSNASASTSSEKAEEKKPQSVQDPAPAVPGSGKREDSVLIEKTKLLSLTAAETGNKAKYLKLFFDDKQGNNPVTTALVINYHQSLMKLCSEALKKECSIYIHSQKPDAEDAKWFLDDIVSVNGVAYEKGVKVDAELNAAIQSFAAEKGIDLPAGA